MFYKNKSESCSVTSRQNWLLDVGFRWQEMTFSDKNCVKSRNPCYFLSKKSVLNRGPCWLKPCYPGTPCITNTARQPCHTFIKHLWLIMQKQRCKKPPNLLKSATESNFLYKIEMFISIFDQWILVFKVSCLLLYHILTYTFAL